MGDGLRSGDRHLEAQPERDSRHRNVDQAARGRATRQGDDTGPPPPRPRRCRRGGEAQTRNVENPPTVSRPRYASLVKSALSAARCSPRNEGSVPYLLSEVSSCGPDRGFITGKGKIACF
ncbi:Protein of unknown function [Gryllus bimaculatus]|nr:Protein of unknown function [Gryllus bimaculatus]